MWEPEGIRQAEGALGNLKPEEVLFEFEEPLTFVCSDSDGQKLLLHSLCDGDTLSRYLVSATSVRIVEDLKAGRIDLVGALRQPRCWLADIGPHWSIKNLWLIDFDKIPKALIPKPGVMLSPDLEPIFRVRLIGTGVGAGKTKAADVRMAAQAAESGLRGLARITLAAKKHVGQVSRDIRHYSDLPYQYTRVASFEIAFGKPVDRLPGLDDYVFQEMGQLLEKGINQLRTDDDSLGPVHGLSADQSVELFEAIKSLSPPIRGGVDRIELGGSLVEHFTKSLTLTRDDRTRSVQRIKMARTAPCDQPFRIKGVIEEADQGTSTFTLRQVVHMDQVVKELGLEPRFEFDDHLYDLVMDAFNSLEQVVVVGEQLTKKNKALDIRFETETFSVNESG